MNEDSTRLVGPQRKSSNLPAIPKSLAFSKSKPFFEVSEEERANKPSENVEEDEFPRLNSRLDSSMMRSAERDFFNHKILEFNRSRGVVRNGESCSEGFSLELPCDFKKSRTIDKKPSYSERIEDLHFSTQPDSRTNNEKLQLINDSLDFVKKMQSFDLLEEEFLMNERREFEKDELFSEYLEGIVREDTMRSEDSMVKGPVPAETQRKELIHDIIGKSQGKPSFSELIERVSEGNIARLQALVKDLDHETLNARDAEGRTVLLMATKLAAKGEKLNLCEMVRVLLIAGADPRLKDKTGWGPLDEAISHSNVKTTLYIFDYLCLLKKDLYLRQKSMVLGFLAEIPDFYLEMKWDFESSVVPWLGKLAPSGTLPRLPGPIKLKTLDTFRIWKHKTSLRLDYSLVGIKNLKAKKRDMSLIFNPANKVWGRADVQMFNSGKGIELFWLLNKTRGHFTNPLQEIDFYEKKTILYDLMTSQAFEGNMSIMKCEFNESLNWMGAKVSQKLNGWRSKKFDFQLTYEYYLTKKERVSETAGKRVSGFGAKSEAEKKETAFIERIEKMNFPLSEKKEKKVKKNAVAIWISEEFPLKFANESNLKALSPLFVLLSSGNPMIGKMNMVFQNEKIQEVVKSNGFPVRVQIPINFAIRANIAFLSFRFLKASEDLESMFEVPKSMAYCDRKIAMKTLTRQKKRMILTNALI